jgi:alpha-beta hydrolase superfamily lysophospholipase
MNKRSLCLGFFAVAAALASGCAREKWSHADAVAKTTAFVVHQDADPGLPGRLEGASTLNRIDASEIERAIDALGRNAPALAPRYDVINHRLIYYTTDGKGMPIKASGLVSVPVKAPGAPSPVLSYQHATLFNDARAPSNHAVASEVAVVLASLGYIVVAADYVGYGVSRGARHPYLLAEPSAAAVLDLLTAAQSWRRQAGIADNGQLFLTGYSEGGYVTLAAHRAMQTTDSPHLRHLVASVAGGGPYDVGVTVREQLQRIKTRAPVIGTLFKPAILEWMGRPLRREARRWLMRRLVPAHADVRLQASFLDHHFDGDHATIERLSNVHDWKPEAPVSLFHGADDKTVPHASAMRALLAMRSRGAPQVSLTNCPAVPSSHRSCVKPFLDFMLAEFAGAARDR